jgi:exosortase/archaeosortase family protein
MTPTARSGWQGPLGWLDRLDDAKLWLISLSAIASAQATLCWRADVLALAIPSCLAWLFGLLLLEEVLQRPAPAAPPPLLWRLLGWGLLVWCLLVLTLASQFYDPLQQFLPLAALVGVALLRWGLAKRRLLLVLATYGLLVPLQVWGVPRLPDGLYRWVGMATARTAGLGLALIGRFGASDGIYLALPERTVAVAGTCTGLTVVALCIATVLCFQITFQLFRPRKLAVVLLGSVAACFLVNSARVAILALTDRRCDGIDRQFWCQLYFWHDGLGSLLFSLLSVWATCWLIGAAHESNWTEQLQRLRRLGNAGRLR